MRGLLRNLLRDEDRQELHPAREHRRVERIGVTAVLRGEPHFLRAGELAEQVGEVAAGLLVLPVADEVHGHVDLVDEVLGRERQADRVGPVLLSLDPLDDVGRLAVQRLVREAGLVAALDAIGRPPLAAAGRGLGVVLAVLRPRDREARC